MSDRLEVFRTGETPEEPTLAERWAERIISGPSILEQLAPVRFIVPGLVPADMVTAVYGPPKSGKSHYALTLALELARGGRWNGHPLEPTPVLYIAAERASDVRDRLEGWSRHHSTEVPGAFHLWPAEYPQLTSAGIWPLIAELMSAIGARVIVWDTFARVTLGVEENSSKDIGPVMENLERLAQATEGGAVLFVHHTGKDTSRGMRGSSAILGAVSSGIEVSGSEGYITATLRDTNVGPGGGAEHYRLESVELPPLDGTVDARFTATLIPGGEAPLEGEHLDLVLEVLADSYQGEASRRQLGEALRAHGRAVHDSTLGSWLTALHKSGRIERVGKGPATRWRLTESPREETLGLDTAT